MDSKNKKIVVLCSGGVDSSLLLAQALREGNEVFPLNVQCGFAWETAEQHYLRRLLDFLANPRLQPLKTATVSLRQFFPNHWGFTEIHTPLSDSEDSEVYIPQRNLLLLTMAALYAEAEDLGEIWLGTLKANPFQDASADFFSQFEQILQQSSNSVAPKIRTPFISLKKEELIRAYPDFPFHLAFSCLSPKGLQPCGQCNKCEEKKIHLVRAGIPLDRW